MNVNTRIFLPCAVLSALVASGCGLFSSQEEAGVANGEELTTAIEKVHVECELAQSKVRDTTDLMTSLVTGNYQGDPTDVYLRFVRSLEESEKQAGSLRDAIDAMKSSSKPVFEGWRENLLSITNPTLRRESEARLEASSDRFNSLVASARSSQTGFDSFNQGARDIKLFLGNDFNPSAVATVAPEARKVEDLAIDLDERLLDTQTAVQDYMQASGLPMPGTAAEGQGDFAAPAPGGGANPRR